MVDVLTLLALVTSAIVVVVIIDYAFQTKRKLLKVKNGILRAEKKLVSLCNRPLYQWRHTSSIVTGTGNRNNQFFLRF